MNTTTDDILIIDNISADTIEVGDQLIIENELVIVLSVDNDRFDIDEIFLTVDNLSGDENEFSLFADDYFDVWSI